MRDPDESDGLMPDAPDALQAILDRPDPADEAAAPDPAAAPAAAPAPAADAPAADPFDTGADSFDRAYVEKLRHENAGYRTRAKTYEDVFAGYSDDDRQWLLDLAKNVRENPAGASQMARDLAEALAPAPGPTGEPAAPDTSAAGLTEERLQAILDQRDTARRESEAVRGIESEAKGLGYDPDSAAYVELLWRAHNETNGDLTKAHEAMAAERQKVIDEYLAAKTADPSVTPSPATGVTPGGEHKIGGLADAKAAMEESLEAQFGPRRGVA